MKLDQKAKQYSEALFNVAVESQSETEVKDSLINVCNAIRNSAEFRSFLLSKRVSNPDKAKVTKEVFSLKKILEMMELMKFPNQQQI